MARAKQALASLPWVDQKTVEAEFKTKEVRFIVPEMSQFNEQELRDAFKKREFSTIEIVHKPEK